MNLLCKHKLCHNDIANSDFTSDHGDNNSDSNDEARDKAERIRRMYRDRNKSKSNNNNNENMNNNNENDGNNINDGLSEFVVPSLPGPGPQPVPPPTTGSVQTTLTQLPSWQAVQQNSNNNSKSNHNSESNSRKNVKMPWDEVYKGQCTKCHVNEQFSKSELCRDCLGMENVRHGTKCERCGQYSCVHTGWYENCRPKLKDNGDYECKNCCHDEKCRQAAMYVI